MCYIGLSNSDYVTSQHDADDIKWFFDFCNYSKKNQIFELKAELGAHMENRDIKHHPEMKSSGQKSSLKIFLWDTRT